MKERITHFFVKYPRSRYFIGTGLIIVGLIALVTPLTPGSWLIFIGLEVFGIRMLSAGRIKAWWRGEKT